MTQKVGKGCAIVISERDIEMSRRLRGAIHRLDIAQTRELLENGACPNSRAESQDTPLIFTIKNARNTALRGLNGDAWVIYSGVEIALLLLEAGADVEGGDHPEGATPLRWALGVACKKGLELLEELLRRGANPNALDRASNAPLHALASDELAAPLHGRPEWDSHWDKAIQLMVDSGADLNLRGAEGTPADAFHAHHDQARCAWLTSIAESRALTKQLEQAGKCKQSAVRI